MQKWKEDKKRGGVLPAYQYWFRLASSNFGVGWQIVRLFAKLMLKITRFMYGVEIGAGAKIGGGLYIGHPYCITVNPHARIGRNCSLHKGVTIGQENRGRRKGAPVIGDCVWMGVNSTIVGGITIGDDVLIAPNTYVNCDVPEHSVVFGNPCIIKHRDNATDGYINNKID